MTRNPASDDVALPSLLREAEAELIARLFQGFYPAVLLVAVLAMTTSIAVQHPWSFGAVAGSVVLTTALRIFLKVRERQLTAAPSLLRFLIVFTVTLSTATAGLLYGGTLWYYGFENWNFTVVMLWTVGTSCGATISFTPDIRLLRLYIVLILTPALSVGLIRGGAHGETFAFATLILIAFLLMQGTRLNATYWKQICAHSRESARVCELEAAKLEAESATRAAERASHAKSEFLANMSHEIPTPMNAVMGMTSLLLDTDIRGESREFVEIIRSSSDSLLTIINDILDFSKIESGMLELEDQPFDLVRCVEEAVDLLAPQAALKKLELLLEIDPAVPLWISGDVTRLRQVLVNLIGNAVKFTADGEVVVSICRELGRLRFAVRDTGPGIPAGRMDRMFRSFSQVDTSTTRKYGGTGLGLAISARLTALIARRQPLRILLADDNVVNQRVAVRLLERFGYRPDVASNGLEVLAAIERQVYDVVLMDLQMPEMDGLEAARRITERSEPGSRPRLIALTANVLKEDREQCAAAGMDDFLAKPMHLAELQDALLRCERITNSGAFLTP